MGERYVKLCWSEFLRKEKKTISGFTTEKLTKECQYVVA